MTKPPRLRVAAWRNERRPPRTDALDERPLALCISGGGFRSYACALGQLRALHDLGVMDRVGLISGVSGGAWAAMVHTFAPATTIRDRLGPALAPEELGLSALEESVDADHLGRPVTELDAITLARSVDPSVPRNRVFSHVLNEQLLRPLGIELDRPVLSAGPEHTRALLRRNPELEPDDVLEMPDDRPPAIAGAAAMVSDDEGGHTYKPVELGPLVLPAGPEPVWSFRALESAALAAELASELEDGGFDVTLENPPFGLGDILAASGGAPAGLLVQLARRLGFDAEQLVLHVAHWLAGDGSPPFLVDGGYVDNTGLLAALRHGAEHVAVMVNTNQGASQTTNHTHVAGVEGQISRLFGRAPTWGMYRDSPLPLFPEEELDTLAEALAASRDRGELPWASLDHHVRPDNALGLEPRPVRVMWQLNEIPRDFHARLPDETQRALASPFGALHGLPHLPVAFAYWSYVFRLSPHQLGFLVAMHDQALRGRPDEIWPA